MPRSTELTNALGDEPAGGDARDRGARSGAARGAPRPRDQRPRLRPHTRGLVGATRGRLRRRDASALRARSGSPSRSSHSSASSEVETLHLQPRADRTRGLAMSMAGRPGAPEVRRQYGPPPRLSPQAEARQLPRGRRLAALVIEGLAEPADRTSGAVIGADRDAHTAQSFVVDRQRGGEVARAVASNRAISGDIVPFRTRSASVRSGIACLLPWQSRRPGRTLFHLAPPTA